MTEVENSVFNNLGSKIVLILSFVPHLYNKGNAPVAPPGDEAVDTELKKQSINSATGCFHSQFNTHK